MLARSPHVLLDFDAPSVRSGAGTTDRAIADELRQLLAHAPLPADVADAKDPFIVLRYAAALGPRVRRQGRATVPGLEVQAIPTATTTADAHNAIRALKRAGYTITIVSNDSDTAVIKYVTAHGLREHIDGIAGRTSSDAAELKPNPALLLRAATALGSEPAQCVRIGDSVTDMQAAQATGSAAPGYANKPGKYARLLAQKPDAVIDAERAYCRRRRLKLGGNVPGCGRSRWGCLHRAYGWLLMRWCGGPAVVTSSHRR